MTYLGLNSCYILLPFFASENTQYAHIILFIIPLACNNFNSPRTCPCIIKSNNAASSRIRGTCGGAQTFPATATAVRGFSGRIVKASSQFPIRVFSLSPNFTTPLTTPAFSAFLSGSAGHHAALFDLAEPAIAVIARSSADSVAMAVQSRG